MKIPMANQTITVALNKKVSITVTSANEAFSLDSPIYAINWFNVKSERLYDFYNLLAGTRSFAINCQHQK